MKMIVFATVGALVFGFAIGAGTQDLIQRHNTRVAAVASPPVYTPSTAPVFADQLHTNVIMSANGGRTVFVTR